MRAPTVIIGVGGIGSEICTRVARMLPPDAPDNQYIRFVTIDTDVNTIKDQRRNGFSGVQIQISDNMTVNACLKSLPESIWKWYPQNEIFDRKPMTEGAGQQRAISRLALEYSIARRRMYPLCAVIDQLNELDVHSKNQPTELEGTTEPQKSRKKVCSSRKREGISKCD